MKTLILYINLTVKDINENYFLLMYAYALFLSTQDHGNEQQRLRFIQKNRAIIFGKNCVCRLPHSALYCRLNATIQMLLCFTVVR